MSVDSLERSANVSLALSSPVNTLRRRPKILCISEDMICQVADQLSCASSSWAVKTTVIAGDNEMRRASSPGQDTSIA